MQTNLDDHLKSGKPVYLINDANRKLHRRPSDWGRASLSWRCLTTVLMPWQQVAEYTPTFAKRSCLQMIFAAWGCQNGFLGN
jgi:hypothetical protein